MRRWLLLFAVVAAVSLQKTVAFVSRSRYNKRIVSHDANLKQPGVRYCAFNFGTPFYGLGDLLRSFQSMLARFRFYALQLFHAIFKF